MIADRYRPLKALQLPQLLSIARKAAAKRPSDLDVMLHCWAEASLRHAKLEWLMALRSLFDEATLVRPERFKGIAIQTPDWFLDAYEAARSLTKGDAKPGIYRVYVLLLAGVPGSPNGSLGLYVGESHLKPSERLAQHLAGTNAARVVQRFGVAALPSFCPHLVKLSREDSTRLEAELAEKLRVVLGRFRLAPHRVQGGH